MADMKSTEQVFELGTFRCASGRTLPNVRIGFETYGTLNDDASNAILVCHYFAGNARAAGPANESHTLPGWWDKLIGPGKALDTDRYFIVSSNTLANLNVFDGHTVTTGPASIDPDSGMPYGADFPIVTVPDFVHVQKCLLDHLGIESLVAVAGPSGGSAQAIQWSVEYPQMTPRVIAAISPGLYIHPYAAAMMECWVRPIVCDPLWKQGDYDAANPPLEGMVQALRLVNLTALSYDVLEEFGYAPADESNPPADSLDNAFRADFMLDEIARSRASALDANSFVYMSRAFKLYDVRHRLHESRARYLFLPVETDQVFPPRLSLNAVQALREAGLEAELHVLESTGGHLDGLLNIDQAGDRIRAFLQR